MNIMLRGKVLLSTALTAATLLTGCGDSEDFVFTNTNQGGGVNAPIAVDDSFNALGNATLNQAAANGVLTNDTVNGGVISAFDPVGSQGGAIALNSDGSFTYTPVTGFVGTETFSYTLSNSRGNSTATVTLTSTGLGQFVDNSAASNGTGTQADPFNNLSDAVNAAQNGDTIFVSRGDGTNTGLTGGFNLPVGVDLIGEGTGLILAQTIVPAGQAPVIGGPISCGGDNLISGLTIDGSTTVLVDIVDVGDVTVTNCTLSNPTEEHISALDFTGTLTITNNTFDQPANNDEDYVYLCGEVPQISSAATVSNNIFANTNNQDVDSLVDVFTAFGYSLDLTFSGNQAIGTQADQFDYGLYFDNEGESGTCTVTADNNQLENFESCVLSAFDCTGSFTNNMIDGSGPDGIYVGIDRGTFTITGNIISDVNDGMCLYYNDGNSATFIVANNTISECSADGIYLYQSADVDAFAAFRNNTISNTDDAALDLNLDDDFDLCLDITGNTVDDDMVFDDLGSGVMNVEQFGDNTGDVLQTVNDFTAGTVVVETQDPVSVADGFCNIP